MSVNLADLVATLQVNATELVAGVDKAIKTVEGMAQSFQTQANSLVGLDNAAKGYIKSLERQAAATGATKAELLEMKRVWDVIDYGDSEAAVNRINAAYDKLEQNLHEVQDAANEKFNLSPMQELGTKLNDIAGSAARLGLALSAAVTAPIVKLANDAITLASSFQQAEIAFTTMLGSARDASQFLVELKDFAAKTPFEFPDLLNAAKRLQALGFAAEDTIPIMRSVGDAVAGLGGGAALIDRVTLALGQMRAKGKVSAEEMRQLAEAGIPAWETLAKTIGVSVPEAMKMASKGAIDAATAVPAILEGMSEKFGNLMSKQATTAAGQFSNFKDQVTFILADIGKVLLPFANMVIQEVAMPLLTALRGMATAFAEAPPYIQTTIVAVTALLAAVGPVLLAVAGLASTLGSLAPVAGSLAVALGFGSGGIAAALAVATPLAIAFGAAIAGMILYKVITDLMAVNAELERFEGLLGKGQVASKAQADEIKLIESALASYNRQIGVTRVEVSSAGKSVKEYLDALRAAAFSIDLFGQSTKNARAEVAEAEAKLNKLKEAASNGAANFTALSQAAEDLRSKKAALNAELESTKARLEAANIQVAKTRTEMLAAKKVVEDTTVAFEAGKVGYDKVAEAQSRLDGATTAFNNATAKAAAVMDAASGEAGRYSGSLEQMRARMAAGAVHTKSLEDRTKDLKASMKAATQEYQQALRQYEAGKTTMEQLGQAWFKLQAAQDKAEPEKAAKRHGEAAQLMQKQQDELVKFFSTAAEKLKALDEGVAKSVTDLSNDFAAAYQKIVKAADDAVKIIVPLNKRLPEGILEAVKEVERIAKVYSDVGLKTPADLKKVADANRAAWEQVKRDAGTNSAAALAQWIKMREAEIALARSKGEEISKLEQEQLNKAKEALSTALGDQETSWQKFTKQVSTIVNDLAKDIAGAFVEFFKGFFDDSFNEGLRQQTADIEAELENRTEAFTQFNQDIAQQEEEVRTTYADNLAEDTATLTDALAERLAETETFVNDTIAAFEVFKQEEAARLDEQLTDLAQHLAEEEAEYEDFQQEVGAKQQEIREETAAQLAATLNDLEDHLRDGKQAYEDFVNDANQSLSRLGEDLTESISDIEADSADDRLKENKKYTRKVEDLQDDLAEAIKKKDKQREAEIRRQLQREEEDHRDTLAQIDRDEEDAVSDARRRAERQTADVKTDLDRRARDFTEFLAENAEKQQEAVDKSKQREQDQLDNLEESVKKKTEAILKLREDTHAKEEEATAKSIDRVAKEEEAVVASIEKRVNAYNKFSDETQQKIADVTAASNAAQDAELAKIAKTATDKAAEYEKFKLEAIAQIEDLESKLQGPLDRLKELFSSVFEGAINAALRLGSEAVLGWLIKRFKDDFGGVLDGILGTLGKIFGIGSTAATPSIPTVPSVPSTPSVPGGGAASAASGALGVANLVTGIVSAVADVISAIYSIRLEGTMNQIERNTAAASIHLLNILTKANELWPKLTDIHSALGDLILPTLQEIRDGLKTLFSVNLNLTDEQQNQLFSSLLTRVGHFDTVATDRLLDIYARLGDVLTATQAVGEAVRTVVPEQTGRVVEQLGRVVDKLPSTVDKLFGGLGGLLGASGALPAALAAALIGVFGGGTAEERTEENTRYTAIAMIGPAGVVATLREYLPKLQDISDYFANVQSLALNNISDALNGQIPDRILQVHDLMRSVPGDIAQIRDLIRDRPIVVPVSQGAGPSGNQFYITYSANDPRGWAGLTEEIIARGGKV